MITVVGLTGNPNCGKTTLFNKLTGSSQRVGNWPGVTIDRVEGPSKYDRNIKIVDLPGVYSLSPYSPEENVTRDFLLDSDPDVVLNVVDASNLERNLYLTLQILDLQFPTVVALNMMDLVEKKNLMIDIEMLSKFLGCPVVPISAVKEKGLDKLMEIVSRHKEKAKAIILSHDIEKAISEITKLIKDDVPEHEKRWHSTKILSRDIRTVDEHPELWNDAKPIVHELEKKYDDLSDSIIAGGRYDVICRITSQCVKKITGMAPDSSETYVKDKWRMIHNNNISREDQIDAILTDKWLGIPIFIGILFLVYTISVGTVGLVCTDWINNDLVGSINDWAREALKSAGASTILVSLICDGVITGVGAVISFLPQILLLFLFITILEDCGYMSRICFMFDRIFRKFNLSGKSLIPLMVGTGCGVPGIMASKAIENEADRKLTIITTTFIPCSAKLPIIAMIAGALFHGSAIVAVFAYMMGIVCVLISGIILKKLKRFGGEASVFVMELPPYHVPSAFTTVYNALENGWEFLKRAGTLILIACIAVWALSSFTWSFQYLDGDVSRSILADCGKAISWIFIPLGWGDFWEFTVATITALMSKETFVGTLSVLLGENAEAIIGTMITAPAGLSLMIFNLICIPCVAAVGTMKKELGSWKMTGLAALYQCALAYSLGLIIFQFGTWFQTGEFTIGTVAAIIVLAILVALIFHRNPFGYIESKIYAQKG